VPAGVVARAASSRAADRPVCNTGSNRRRRDTSVRCRHQGRPVGADHPAGKLDLHDVPRRVGRQPALVCQVGSTTLTYHLSAVEDLRSRLLEQGDWVPLGAADEKKDAAEGTVEAWGRSADNPVGGWYGLRRGYRGRFGMYLPPLLENLGLAEVTHEKRNNAMRGLPG
jgi:hypothetical protein